jgi:GT2 family glycosyltransferase
MPQPVATVVVVSWNGRHLLPRCLEALAVQTLPRDRFEVWVVDNGSTDGTPQWLAAEHPDVRCIRSERNLGFAGGNDLALREVTTPHTVLLNNDARPEPGFLTALVDELERPGNERVGAVTAKVLLDGPENLLNSTGSEVRVDGNGQDRDWLVPDGSADPPRDVFGFCGAASAVRTEAGRAAGWFDESFFLYYEDTDLSWRMRAAGWTVVYCPEAVVRHEHSATAREGSPMFRFHNERNRLLMVTKNAPWPLVARVLATRLPSYTAHFAREHDVRLLGARLRALGSYLRLLPGALRARRTTWRHAAVSMGEVARLLVPATPASTYRVTSR